MIPNRDWHDHDPRYCISTFQDLRELLPRVKKGTKTIWTRQGKYREAVPVMDERRIIIHDAKGE